MYSNTKKSLLLLILMVIVLGASGCATTTITPSTVDTNRNEDRKNPMTDGTKRTTIKITPRQEPIQKEKK